MAAPMEETDKVHLAVKKATTYLLKGNRVTDDTVIHSFLDHLKYTILTVDCIEKSGLQIFIEEVGNNWKRFDSPSVVLGLKVTAWLAGNAVFFSHFKSIIHHVYTTICRDVHTGDLPDTSVITALYESLDTLVRQKESLQWVIFDQHIAAVTMDGLRLLTESPSIFLEKAIINYVASVIKGVEEVNGEIDVYNSLPFCSRILSTVIQDIRNCYIVKHRRPFVPGCVQLLDSLCRQSQVVCRCLLTQHTLFCEYLVNLIGELETKDCDTVLKTIEALLQEGHAEDKSSSDGKLSCYFISIVEKQLTVLANNGNIVTAQKLAACCLKSEGSERLKEICVDMLTEPVYWILHSSVRTDLVSVNTLQSALSTRCKCTNAICRSLDCPVIEEDVVTDLLRRTTVYYGEDDSSNSKAVTYLYKNRTVRRKCLEVLIAIKTPKIKDDTSKLSTAQVIVELFREPDNDPVIYSLCSQILLDVLPSLFRSKRAITLTETLAEVIQYHLSALQWELRDTTLEFLGKVFENFKDSCSILKWLVEHRLHVHVWQCVTDGESYVRASAISTVYQLCLCPDLLSALIDSSVVKNEDDIIQTMTGITETDTEAFARRPAITFLLKFFKVKVIKKVKDSSNVIPDDVIATIVAASKDFDWEVKLVALECVSFVLQQEVYRHLESEVAVHDVPAYARELCTSKFVDRSDVNVDIGLILKRLSKKKIIQVLFEAVDDYDEKVCEKAFDIFSELQFRLSAHIKGKKEWGKQNGMVTSVHSDELQPEKRDNCFCLVGESALKKRKLDNTFAIGSEKSMKNLHESSEDFIEVDTETDESRPKTVKDLCLSNDSSSTEDDQSGSNKRSADIDDNVLNIILDFDLSTYKARLEKVNDSTDRLLSLIEDILTSENKNDEENSIDCY